MKFVFLLLPVFLSSCSSRLRPSECAGANQNVTLTKKEVSGIQGNVSRFLREAEISQSPLGQKGQSIWRFNKVPEDSVYHKLGLREGDAIYKTNLGEQKKSTNLISDLSGIATGHTDCLYIKTAENSEKIIKIKLKK